MVQARSVSSEAGTPSDLPVPFPFTTRIGRGGSVLRASVTWLGLEFLDEVERTIERILQHPEAWTRVAEHHRRCRTRRFPYGLLYSIEQDVVIISAVMNLRRHPDSWKERM